MAVALNVAEPVNDTTLLPVAADDHEPVALPLAELLWVADAVVAGERVAAPVLVALAVADSLAV